MNDVAKLKLVPRRKCDIHLFYSEFNEESKAKKRKVVCAIVHLHNMFMIIHYLDVYD